MGGRVHGDTYTTTGKATGKATVVIKEDMVREKVNLTGSEVVTGWGDGALGMENSAEGSDVQDCSRALTSTMHELQRLTQGTSSINIILIRCSEVELKGKIHSVLEYFNITI